MVRRADNLLKGSDLPAGANSVEIVCRAVRIPPVSFNSKFILDIDEVYGKTSFPVNASNNGALIAIIGDDYDTWVGCKIKLDKFLTTNPSSKRQAWGLAVVSSYRLDGDAEPKPAKKKGFRKVKVVD